MGAVIAVALKKDRSATETAISMLKALDQKGIEAFGIASSSDVRTTKTIERLSDENVNSPILIGHVFSKILASDKPQPVDVEGKTLVFEGRIYPPNKEFSDAEVAAARLKKNPQENVKTLIKSCEGSFVFVMAEPHRITAGRDPFGGYPLYYGQTLDLLALASNRRALWKVGVEQPKSFPPGHIAIVDSKGFRFQHLKTLVQKKTTACALNVAAEKLERLLRQSVKDRISSVKEITVAFSGGLDSSVIACLARSLGANVHLTHVSMENQPETEQARNAAKTLRLPLHTRFYTEKSVEEDITRVLWLTEEAEAVSASIGIPMYWSAETASEMKVNVMLAGQGADELFGGYRRHLEDYSRFNEDHVRKTLFKDAAGMSKSNIERDSKICNFFNLELRLPFATYQLAEFAVGLPLNLKIESQTDVLRKTLLRRVAKNLGLPRFIVERPKKAVQYSTGVSKVLKKLAKQKGLDVNEYLRMKFCETWED